MRPVSLRSLARKIPADWATRASKALEEVRQAAAADRAALINKKKVIWSDLKEILMTHSETKCWYCESTNVGADNAVDHFRPKNSVKLEGGKTHGGYWWLAFDWENYRFSCSFCNSIHSGPDGPAGKQDHFPLVKEETRVWDETGRISEELPVLLDPLNADDCLLLTFDDTGQAVPVVDRDTDPVKHARARDTIEILNLNHKTLLNARYAAMSDARQWLKEADSESAAGREPKSKINDLWDAQEAPAPFSWAVRALIGAMRATSGTAKSVHH